MRSRLVAVAVSALDAPFELSRDSPSKVFGVLPSGSSVCEMGPERGIDLQ